MALGLATRRNETLTGTTFQESAIVVDEAAGIAKDLAVLGPESLNGRTYTESCMRGAAPLYEGAAVYVDHAEKPGVSRSYRDRFGTIRNAGFREGKVRGDLHYNPKHPLAEQFAWDAQHAPENCGLSHNVQGRSVTKSGRTVVESIQSVRSVDLVAEPATNKTLTEGIAMLSFKQVIDKAFGRKPGFDTFREMMGDDAAMAELPVEAPADAPADDQIKAAFRAAAMAAFDDSSLDTTQTLAKIKEILKAYDKVSGEEPAEKPADPPADTPTEESVKLFEELRGELKTLRQERTARDVLESFHSSPAIVGADTFKLLCEQKDEAAMRALVETLPPAKRGVQRPLTEGRTRRDDGPVSFPQSSADLIEALRS
jgi:hypothetical protein